MSSSWGAKTALAVCMFTALASPAAPQEKQLERSFSAEASHRYRVRLAVRSEVAGQQIFEVGRKGYVQPFTRWVEGSISWRATRRILSVVSDGSAEIEETLDEFREPQVTCSGVDTETQKLAESLRLALREWSVARTLRYRETRAGQLQHLEPAGLPGLGEASPPVLTLWLLRALRPTAVLPAAPVRFAAPWQEPRGAQLPNWTGVRGSEFGEWLEAQNSPEPAVRLHTVQQLVAQVASGEEKAPEGTAEARFHGESLNTISLSDARLLAATRSATREIAWTLGSIEGLPEPPRLRGRLAVEVTIEACNATPCLATDDPTSERRP